MLFVSQVNATFYFSPYYGSQVSSQHNDIENNNSNQVADETTFQTTGTTYGVRTGWFFFRPLALGIDYKKTSLKGEGQGITFDETTIERVVEEEIIFTTLLYQPSYSKTYRLWLGVAVYGMQKDSGNYNFKGQSEIIPWQSFKAGFAYDFFKYLTFSVEVEQLKTKKNKNISQGDTADDHYTNIYLEYPTSRGRSTNVTLNISFNLMKLFKTSEGEEDAAFAKRVL